MRRKRKKKAELRNLVSQIRADLIRADQTRANRIRAGLTRANLIRAGLIRADQTRVNLPRSVVAGVLLVVSRIVPTEF